MEQSDGPFSFYTSRTAGADEFSDCVGQISTEQVEGKMTGLLDPEARA